MELYITSIKMKEGTSNKTFTLAGKSKNIQYASNTSEGAQLRG